MADVGKKTGKKTQAGRDVYKTPEGELVSEKSTTFKYKGKWVNVPTIFDGKSYDEETLILMLEADIIKPTSIHNSLKEATEAARKRSDSLKFNEGGMADQTEKAFGGAFSRRPGFRSLEEAKGQVSQEELIAGVENAASFLVPFYDAGVNVSNVIEEYMKPEEERNQDYIKEELGKAGESAAYEAAAMLAGFGAIKYGGKAISALKNKVKDYEIDTSTVSAFGVGAIKKKSPVDRSADVVEAERLLDDPKALADWQKTEGGKGQRQKNPKASEEAAEALYQGEITSKEARKIIEDAIPSPELYTSSNMPEMPTVTEVVGSLGKKAGKYGILGVKGFDLKKGQEVSSRLDIPAYNNYDKWVVSIHDGTKDAGAVVGFGQAIRLKNIRFGSKSKESLDIARRKVLKEADPEKGTPEKRMGKSTIARIFGEYVPEDPYKLQEEARRLLADPDSGWTQVGMNPYRKSAFYDKATGKPVFEADEVIQVGPLVLAKNVKKATISQMKEMGVRTKDDKIRVFNEGGAAMNMQKQMSLFEYGGIADDGMKKDPVSGNDIPPGSLASEVRDDIPAMLSEGEYVVPADVLRYYGVNFFEGLRNKAKQGLQSMEQNGRIGGEPLTPQQIQQNMSGAPQAGAPAPMPVQANQGILTMPKEYTQQAQMLGGGGFNPADWTTVGGSTFGVQLEADSVTTFKTFVNAESGERKIIEYINGKLKNPADEQYTVPPYYEYGSAALKKAQNQITQTVRNNNEHDGRPPKEEEVQSGNSLISAFDDMDLSDPLGAAKAMMANVTDLGGNAGAALAASVAGPAGMGFMGLAQSGNALTNISNLNALSILAEAQGKTKEAETIAKMADDLAGKSNLITQALDDIVATGKQKGKQLIDKYGLRGTRDPKTGRFTFSQDDIKYNKSYLSTYTLAKKDETAAILQGGGATGDDDGPTVTAGGGTRARDPDSGPSTGKSTFTGPVGDKYTFDSEDMTIEEEAENDAIFDAIDAQFEAAGVSQNNKGGLMARKKANKK